jgi:hypothetical protein
MRDPDLIRQALLATRLFATRAFQGSTFTFTLASGQPSTQIAENPGSRTSAFLVRFVSLPGKVLISTSSGGSTELSLPAQGASNVISRFTLGPDEQLWAQRPAGAPVTITVTEVRL